MKKIFTLVVSALCGLVIVFTFANAVNETVASPGGYTGSPAEAKDCTECHDGPATSQAGIITSNIPVSGYVPGSTYTITVTLNTSTTANGFEVSPQSQAGALLGTLTPGNGTQLCNSDKAVTHTEASIANKTWSFSWTAPAKGTGAVTFYGAFAEGYSVIKKSTLVVSEDVSTGIASKTVSKSNLTVSYNASNLEVSYNVVNAGKVNIQLFDITGKLAQTVTEENAITGNNHKTMNVSNLEKGVYILKLENEGSFSSKKVFIY